MARTYRTYVFGRELPRASRDADVTRMPGAQSDPSIPPCPMCDGHMEIVYDRQTTTVAVCIDCHSGITVPQAAREVVRMKRDGKWHAK